MGVKLSSEGTQAGVGEVRFEYERAAFALSEAAVVMD
jgi:hypothetical protein